MTESVFQDAPISRVAFALGHVDDAFHDAQVDGLKALNEIAEWMLVAKAALEEIADVPGRSVTSIIARRALDGLR